MIPESGTRNELKHAWFEARLLPAIGEFYASRQFYGMDKQYLRVREINLNRRRPGESTVLCDSFTYTAEFPMLVREARHESMNFDDWTFMIDGGFMDYAGDNLPVATGVVMREQ